MRTEKLSPDCPPEEQYKILSHGAVDLIDKEDFKEKLKSKKPLKVKAGFDPSKPDLHLGHSSLINKLRQFQELGHEVIFVVGDFTACIGDPSGQNKTRPMLSYEEAKKNAQSYIQQATEPQSLVKVVDDRRDHKDWSQGAKELKLPREDAKNDGDEEKRKIFKREIEQDEKSRQALSFFKRLDFEKTNCRYNSEWLDEVSLKKFIMEICSKFTVAPQLERRDFSLRYKDGKPIGLHEFLYPLIQAYDSVQLEADVELGGTDQLFNLLLGRELQEQKGQEPQTVLTLPLLEGIDAGKWRKIHDMKVYKIYKEYKEIQEKIQTVINDPTTYREKLCRELSQDKDFKNYIFLSSIKMKFENFRYLDSRGQKGLKKYSAQNKEVFDEFKNCSISDLKKAIEKEIKGARKMSKSLGNAIAFNDSPKNIYGGTMKISDKLLDHWWNVFTEGRVKNLHSHFDNKSLHPKKEKEKLAWIVVRAFHGEDKAHQAREEFSRVFSNKGLPDQILEDQDILWPDSRSKLHIDLKGHENKINVDENPALLAQNQALLKQNKDLLKQNEELLEQKKIKLYQLIKKLGLSSSASEARKAVLSGAVRFRANWKFIHDLKAYLVYRKIKEGGDREELCQKLSQDEDFKNYISLGSIRMKIENYRHRDTGEGLSGYSRQSNEVFDKFKDQSIKAIEKAIQQKEEPDKESLEPDSIKLENPDDKITLERGDELLFSLGKRKFKRVNLKWKFIHDLKAYLVYRKIKEGGDREELCQKLSQDEDFKNYISLGSIRMKIENYRYRDTGEGLSGYSRQSNDIFDKFKDQSIKTIEEAIQRIEEPDKESPELSSSASEARKAVLSGAVRFRANWKFIHDLKAYLVYKKIKEGGDREELCQKLSQDEDFKNYISLGSIRMKIENYRYRDTGEGLSGYSRQSNDIFDKFKDQSIKTIEEAIQRIEEPDKESLEPDSIKLTNPDNKITLERRDELLSSLGKRKFKRVNLKWKFIHDLKAYLVYRKIKEGGDREELCQKLSQDEDFKNYISLGSIRMKIENYRYRDTGEGLSGYSRQSKEVFDKFKDQPITAIREAIDEGGY